MQKIPVHIIHAFLLTELFQKYARNIVNKPENNPIEPERDWVAIIRKNKTAQIRKLKIFPDKVLFILLKANDTKKEKAVKRAKLLGL
jgi:histidinol-phosphate/aromatic aminotransferase/cobyric acid decarboxylase-like protein